MNKWARIISNILNISLKNLNFLQISSKEFLENILSILKAKWLKWKSSTIPKGRWSIMLSLSSSKRELVIELLVCVVVCIIITCCPSIILLLLPWLRWFFTSISIVCLSFFWFWKDAVCLWDIFEFFFSFLFVV